MDLKEINKQINELQKQRMQLEKEDREKFKIEAKKNVGRCFIVSYKNQERSYVKVIDIPQEISAMTGTILNEYQYPAIYIEEKEKIPFEEDDLFSGAWNGIKNIAGLSYKEITEKEFNKKFEEVLENFKNKIINI